MKIGIFGGSFDPIHNSHINLAVCAKELLDLDKVYFVPTATSPEKANLKKNVSTLLRLKMVEQAISIYSGFLVCDFEIFKGGISYTIDTINYFKDLYPKDELYLIMGEDQLSNVESWKDYKEILKKVKIVTGRRGLDKPILVDCVMIPEHSQLSSTKIRNLLSKGEDVSQYIPAKTLKVIKDQKLYGVS